MDSFLYRFWKISLHCFLLSNLVSPNRRRRAPLLAVSCFPTSSPRLSINHHPCVRVDRVLASVCVRACVLINLYTLPLARFDCTLFHVILHHFPVLCNEYIHVCCLSMCCSFVWARKAGWGGGYGDRRMWQLNNDGFGVGNQCCWAIDTTFAFRYVGVGVGDGSRDCENDPPWPRSQFLKFSWFFTAGLVLMKGSNPFCITGLLSCEQQDIEVVECSSIIVPLVFLVQPLPVGVRIDDC